MDVPVHSTKNLIFRGLQEGDLEEFCVILGNETVVRYLPLSTPWPEVVVRRWLSRLQKHWDDQRYGWWIVEHKTDHRAIGWCGLNWLEETGETEVLYLLDEPYWGRGLATEGARFSISYGFENTSVDEIIGLVFEGNIASRRVLENAGLQYQRKQKYFGFELLKYKITRAAWISRGNG